MSHLINRTLHAAAAMLSAAVLSIVMFNSCGLLGSITPERQELSLSLKNVEVDSPAASQFVTIGADGEWTISVSADAADDEVGWAWFRDFYGEEDVVELQGSGNSSTLILYWSKNVTGADRTCILTLSSGNTKVSCTMLQHAAVNQGENGGEGGEPATPVEIEPQTSEITSWMELPAMDSSDGLLFITHDMTIGSKKVRNYAYGWDTTALVAHWVAYPLNSSLIGNGSRTNLWNLDPKLPRRLQPVLFKGFSGGYYDRGHQCPSADRLASGANEQTFYGTNMTPQRGSLNQKAWAVFEGMVRDWSRTFDTLYVVTGCDIAGAYEQAFDNDGKAVTVPVGYYKALLGYKKSGGVGITSTTGGYTGVAFYFEHKSYSESRENILELGMSIDQLEEKLGMDFFTNLPAAIGSDLAGKVESTLDPYWTK